MKRDIGFSIGFVVTMMLSFGVYVLGVPYYEVETMTASDCIAYVIVTSLLLVPSILFIGCYHGVAITRLGCIYMLSASFAILTIVIRCMVQNKYHANAVGILYVLEFVIVVSLSWGFRKLSGKQYPAFIDTAKCYAPFLAVLIACICVVIISVQVVLHQRCSAIYYVGSTSYLYSFQHLQWMVTAGGFVIMVLSTLICIPFLEDQKNRCRNRKSFLFVFLILLFVCGFSFLRIKGLIYPDGNVMRLASVYERSNRSVNEEKRFEQPFWVCSSRKTIERWNEELITEETLLVKQAYDATDRLRGRVLVTDLSNYYTLQIGETIVGVEYPYFIMFSDNDQQFIYSLDCLDKAEKHPVIISFARNSIESGRFRLFEQCASYLCQYDEEFIHPFLLRYANMEFTEQEQAALADIRIEYVSKMAYRLLEKY